MNKYQLKPEAKNDLEKIYKHTFLTWGVIQADKYTDEIENAFKLIVRDHYIGKKYIYSNKEYRFLHINRHLIFYRIERELVIIIRILHDRMKIKDLL